MIFTMFIFLEIQLRVFIRELSNLITAHKQLTKLITVKSQGR